MNNANDYVKRQCTVVGKWALYVALLYLAYILQTTPYLFEVMGVKPVWLLGVCVSVACLENAYSGAFLGVLGGLLWDLASGRIAGFFTILVALCCFGASLLFTAYFRENKRNVAVVTALASLVVLIADLFFYTLLQGYGGAGYQLVWRIFPTTLYTGLAGALCFVPVRALHRRLRVGD